MKQRQWQYSTNNNNNNNNNNQDDVHGATNLAKLLWKFIRVTWMYVGQPSNDQLIGQAANSIFDSARTDQLFTVPQRVEGWVDLCTTVSAQCSTLKI